MPTTRGGGLLRLPFLPKPIYAAMKGITGEAGLSQWQALCAGILGLAYLEEHHPEVFARLMQDVKSRYPSP